MNLPEPAASLCRLLDEQGVRYEILFCPSETNQLYSPEDGVRAGLGTLPEMAPAFILATKIGFMTAVIPGDRRLSYKKIKKALGLRDVSLASPDMIFELTGTRPGTVPPVNPGLPTLVDERLTAQEFVYAGCGAAQYTLKIHPPDLVRITGASVFDFTEEKATH